MKALHHISIVVGVSCALLSAALLLHAEAHGLTASLSGSGTEPTEEIVPTSVPPADHSVRRGAVVASVRNLPGKVPSYSSNLQAVNTLGLGLGFDFVVVHVGWDNIEYTSGHYRWEQVDDIIEQAAAFGLRVILRIYNTPTWLRPWGSSPTFPPTEPDDLGEFMAHLTQHIRLEGRAEHVLGYVIWNEPNIRDGWGLSEPDPEQYMTLLRAAYSGALRGDPSAIIISAPLAPTETGRGRGDINDLEYLDQLYDYGFRSYAHVVGMNGLGFDHDPYYDTGTVSYSFSRLKYLHDVMEDHGDTRSAWALEVGWLADSELRMGEFEPFKVPRADQWQYVKDAFARAESDWPWLDLIAIWNIGFSQHYPPTSNFYWYDLLAPDLYSSMPPALTPRPGGPDLIVHDMWLNGGQLVVGSPVQIGLRINNIGTGTAFDVYTSWRPYGESSNLLCENLTPSLSPGATVELYCDFAYGQAGGFDTHAKVDYFNSVPETVERNNTRTMWLEVRDP